MSTESEIPVVDATQSKTGTMVALTGPEADVEILIEAIKGLGHEVLAVTDRKSHPVAPETEKIVYQGVVIGPIAAGAGDEDDEDGDDGG